MLKIKGHEIPEPKITASFGRRAVQFEGHIVNTLKNIGVDSDYIKVSSEKFATQNLPASVSWYFEGRSCKYTYGLMPRFVENMYVIDKILSLEAEKLISKELTLEEFSREFSEDDNLSSQLVDARKLLGVDADETDFDVINKAYKKMARTHHPDMSGGDHETFQAINAAHKLIQKELN